MFALFFVPARLTKTDSSAAAGWSEAAAARLGRSEISNKTKIMSFSYRNISLHSTQTNKLGLCFANS
jgi:hypothetical protein